MNIISTIMESNNKFVIKSWMAYAESERPGDSR